MQFVTYVKNQVILGKVYKSYNYKKEITVLIIVEILSESYEKVQLTLKFLY